MMGKARFDINPHVIRQLGSELVSDSVTAIMELIKNSYDADADYVKVTINTKDILNEPTLFYSGGTGYIIIEDNGTGMNDEIIRRSWLVISYSNKRPVNGVKPKTKKQRTPLGDKGLGRLSTQRLARVCEIYSKTETDEYVHAGFEWSSFDKVATLSEVDVRVNNDRFPLNRGTRLILTGLEDIVSWSGDNLERFKAQISQLISPYQENKPFKVYLEIDGESIDVEGDYHRLDEVCVSDISFKYEKMTAILDMRIQLLKLKGNAQNADFYNLYIAPDNGEAFKNYLLKKKKSSLFRSGRIGEYLHYSDSIDVTLLANRSLFEKGFSDPGTFDGRIREFSFLPDNSSWEGVYKNFDFYKAFVQNQIGVKLYRNGFAVKPYGIDGQDWLELGKGQTSGSSFYGLRPRNVIGYIAIDEEQNKNLKDKTDREGLIDNDYYRSFYRIILEIIRRVNEAMQILRRTYNDYIKDCQSSGTVRTYKQAVKRIEDNAQRGTALISDFKDATTEILEIRKKISKVQTDQENLFGNDSQLKEETLGQTSAVLAKYGDLLQKALDLLETAPELKESIDIIIPMVDKMRTQLEDFTTLASLGLVSEMVSHDLGQVINRLLSESKKLTKKIENGKNIEKEDVQRLIEYIKTTATSVRAQLKHLNTSFKYNKENKATFSIREFVEKDEKGFYLEKLDKRGVKLDVDTVSDFYVTVNKGKMTQVFDNLINNSLYWLRKYGEKYVGRELVINVTIKKPFVYFEDNGWGVEKNVEDSIFEPFVTRKPVGEGRGLGLYIIKNLLNTDNCDVILAEDRNSIGQRYKFILNLSNIVEGNGEYSR